MKRKTILVLLVLVVLALGSSYASASGLWGTLWAGQNESAGEFNCYVDLTGTDLRIIIYPLGDWKITESHVAVHTSPANIPQNKKGNPKPGHFTWGQNSAPTTTPHEYTIPFSEIEGGLFPGLHTLYIAIHAVVVKTDSFGCIIQNETAWDGPCRTKWFPGDPHLPYPFMKLGTNRWGYYFEFEVTVPPAMD